MAFQFPASPTVGQLFSPASGINFRWNGTAWFPVGAGGAVKISDTEPVLANGEEWYESDTGGFFMRYVNPDGTATLVALAGAGGDFVPIASTRNLESRIINGNFAIDQRRAGSQTTVSADGTYVLDRWINLTNGGGSVHVTRVGNAQEYAMNFGVVAVDSSLAANDYYAFGQTIEGYNIADLQFGTAGASPFTFACRIFSSTACTLPIAFRNGAATRSYVKKMILAAGWQTVTLTIPGETNGSWNSNHLYGLQVLIGLGVGSNFHAPATDAWQTGNYFGATGCTNLMADGAMGIVVAQARLYPGTVDYGPCRRLYADELRLCQRYYWEWQASPTGGAVGVGASFTTNAAEAALSFPVEMRASPTMSVSAASDFGLYDGAGFACTSLTSTAPPGLTNVSIQATVASGLTPGKGTKLQAASPNARLKFSAEL